MSRHAFSFQLSPRLNHRQSFSRHNHRQSFSKFSVPLDSTIDKSFDVKTFVHLDSTINKSVKIFTKNRIVSSPFSICE